MAEALKIIGQSYPSVSVLTDIYTVGVAKSAAISSISICNQSMAAAKFRISVAIAGAADTAAQYLYLDQDISPKSTFIATVGLTLAATDVLRVWSSNGMISFVAFGSEVS